MTERRVRDRFLCADLVKVIWKAGEDDFRTVEAVLEDIAAPGACVQVEEPIPLGATLSLTLNDGAHFSGHVCYCVFRDYGYFVGVHFADDTAWSAESGSPRHLTNLRAIADLCAAEPVHGTTW